MSFPRFPLASVASLGLAIGLATAAPAQMPHTDTSAPMPHTATPAPQFQRVDQPLWLRVAVTAGGLGLIGLEVWWFVLSKPLARQVASDGVEPSVPDR
jgi:plastocyanin domain-containing protein